MGHVQEGRSRHVYALRLTIASIHFGTRVTTTGELTYREHFGELRFHEALLPRKVIPVPDETVGQRKIWRDLGELVRQADRPLHLKDFAKHIGTPNLSRAAFHLCVERKKPGSCGRLAGTAGGWR